MAIFKYLFWIISLIVVSLVIAVLLLFAAPMTYQGLIEHIVKSSSGYELELGDLEVSLKPASITMKNISLSNPSAPATPVLFKGEQVTAKIYLQEYIEGSNDWWEVNASSVDIDLEDFNDGTTNWTLTKPSGEAESPQNTLEQAQQESLDGVSIFQSPFFKFAKIDISDLQFTRVHQQTSMKVSASQLSLEKEQDERLLVNINGSFNNEPISAKGSLALPDSNNATQVSFKASGFGAKLDLDGRVGSDGITPGDASFSLLINEAQALSDLLNISLKNFTPLDISGNLKAPEIGTWIVEAQGELGGKDISLSSRATTTAPRYALSNLTFEYGKNKAQASGELNTKDKSLSANINADSLWINQFISLLDQGEQSQSAVDAQNPSSLNNTLISLLSTFSDWQNDIELNAKNIRYDTYLVSELEAKLQNGQNDIVVNTNVGSISAFKRTDQYDEMGPEALANTDLAEQSPESLAWALTSPASAEIKVNLESFSTQKSSQFELPLSAMVKGKGFYLDANTTLKSQSKIPNSGSIQAQVDNLDALDGPNISELKTMLPIKVDIDLVNTESGLKISPLDISVQNSEITGELQISKQNEDWMISGSLSSSEIDLNKISTTSKTMLAGSGEEIDEDSGDLISNKAIDWSWLELGNADVALSVASFKFNQTELRNAKTHIKLNDGNLVLDPITADLTTGKINGYARLKQLKQGAQAQRSSSNAEIDVRLLVAGLEPADLGVKDKGLLDGGETDLLIDLRANGNTPQALASSLNGEIALEVQKATVRNNLFEIIGSDVLLRTISLINPFSQRDTTTELECAAVYFKANEGVLTSEEQLVIETSKVKIRGGGEINLSNETLSIDFVPSPRDGVGLSLSDMASVVRIGGTLGRPRPVVDPAGIFKAGATIGAALATGGLSILGKGLFQRMRSAGTACGKIFEAQTGI